MMVLVVRAKFRAQIDGKWQDIELTSALASLTAKKKILTKSEIPILRIFAFACMLPKYISFTRACGLLA